MKKTGGKLKLPPGFLDLSNLEPTKILHVTTLPNGII